MRDRPVPDDSAWVAVVPREALFALGRFAVEEAARPDVLLLVREGIAERFAAFAEKEGARFLHDAVAYGIDVLGFAPDPWVFELVQGVLGAAPPPAGAMTHFEQVVHALFVDRLCRGSAPPGRFDLSAGGGGVTLDQVVRTLIANRLLAPQDRVAVALSASVPDELGAHGFDLIEVVVDPDDQQFPDAEIDKLADPTVRAFFLTNPPGAELRPIRSRTIRRIESIVRGEHPDLVIVADESPGTLVGGFRSLAATLPATVVSVYTFGRHFDAPGWQLAVVALHHDNVLDCLIAEFPDDVRAEVNGRYGGESLTFVERMAAESRSSGLSLPQQTQLSLFALYLLTDANRRSVARPS